MQGPHLLEGALDEEPDPIMLHDPKPIDADGSELMDGDDLDLSGEDMGL